MTAEQKSLRDLINELCEIEGSQSNFARRIGASPQKVNNWVNGRNEPGADMLVAISNTYKIPVDCLMGPNATNTEYVVVPPSDPITQDADEMNVYMRRMSEKQRSAVLGVARAMVDC